ncbi:MAG: AAA family ATPase [bacterium]|nr:AAA family ATPase [bacterium]
MTPGDNADGPPGDVLESWPTLGSGKIKPLGPEAVLIEAPDEGPLAIRGHANLLWGPRGIGKTWLVLWLARSILEADPEARLLYASFEVPAPTAEKRWAMLGGGESRIHWAHHPSAGDLRAAAEQHGSGLVLVIDSLESARCPSDTGDVGRWADQWITPTTKAGGTVIGIDHLPKHESRETFAQWLDQEPGDDFPKGSTGKVQLVQGVGFSVRQPAAWGESTPGHLALKRCKDNATGSPVGICGVVGIIPEPDRLRMGWESQVSAAEVIDAGARTRIDWEDALAVFSEHGVPLKKTDLAEFLSGGTNAKWSAIKEWVADGLMVVDKVGNADMCSPAV